MDLNDLFEVTPIDDKHRSDAELALKKLGDNKQIDPSKSFIVKRRAIPAYTDPLTGCSLYIVGPTGDYFWDCPGGKAS